jgi:FkbM family methyltransferase
LIAVRRFLSLVKRTLLRLGIEVELRSRHRHLWLQQLGISTVLDIGANTGQFAAQIRDTLPDAHIYSFDPVEENFRQLQRREARDLRFKAYKFALGDANQKLPFNQNRFSASSSFLDLGEMHKSNFPFAREVEQVEVEVRRLDDLAPELNLEPEILVKLDVQGFEDQVIRGGASVLRTARVVITEVSFQALYEGQPLFGDIHQQLTELGFSLRGFSEQIRSTADDQMLSADAVYVRR